MERRQIGGGTAVEWVDRGIKMGKSDLGYLKKRWVVRWIKDFGKKLL